MNNILAFQKSKTPAMFYNEIKLDLQTCKTFDIAVEEALMTS